MQATGSYAGEREVNVPVRHVPTRHCCSLWWEGKRSTWPEFCQPSEMVLSTLSSCDESLTLSQQCFKGLFGAVSGSTFSKLETFFKNMYNTLHSKCTYFYHINPPPLPMITSLKHSESWDMIIYKDLPFWYEKGHCMLKKISGTHHSL